MTMSVTVWRLLLREVFREGFNFRILKCILSSRQLLTAVYLDFNTEVAKCFLNRVVQDEVSN